MVYTRMTLNGKTSTFGVEGKIVGISTRDYLTPIQIDALEKTGFKIEGGLMTCFIDNNIIPGDVMSAEYGQIQMKDKSTIAYVGEGKYIHIPQNYPSGVKNIKINNGIPMSKEFPVFPDRRLLIRIRDLFSSQVGRLMD